MHLTSTDFVLLAAFACPWGAVAILVLAGTWVLRQLSADGMSVTLRAPQHAPAPAERPPITIAPRVPAPSLRRATNPGERPPPAQVALELGGDDEDTGEMALHRREGT